MTKTHIVYCPLTGVGVNRVFSEEWLKDRIEIFKNYTLKSLLNQTNKDFIIWLSFRPEEFGNLQTLELSKYLESLGIPWFFTHQGLMYYDDRNPEMAARLRFRLYKALRFAATQIKPADWIYFTRVDSDDMLQREVIDLIQSEGTSTKALTLQLGYVYNKDTNEVAEWNPLTNPPFHTVIFPREVFFDAQKHIDWYEGFKSHEDIARLPHKVLWRGDNRQDRLYMVLTHNPQMHISTTWDHPFKGKLVDKEIAKDFGI